MRLLCSTSLAVLLFSTAILAADDQESAKPVKPCTIVSPTSHLSFDLNGAAVKPPGDGKNAHKDEKIESWHARGYDYPANFTMNFCAPVVEQLEDVVGVHENLWSNVSAFYEQNGKTYSIGQVSTELVFRGKKLVLNYTMGSPCASSSTKPRPRELVGRAKDDEDEDDEDDDTPHKKPKEDSTRHKSSIISFLCEREALEVAPKPVVSFVGASPDECAYFFEVRTIAACGFLDQAQQSVGPGGIFAIIASIAAVVYFVGGVAYQRTVMHQRGWRQLPNYSIWAGIINFFKDIFIILTSSCARFLPSRKGYNQLPIHNDRGRGSSGNEDENRLIDQLDDEWDD